MNRAWHSGIGYKVGLVAPPLSSSCLFFFALLAGLVPGAALAQTNGSPGVTTVSIRSSPVDFQTYRSGRPSRLGWFFSADVTVEGTPELELGIGSGTRRTF